MGYLHGYVWAPDLDFGLPCLLEFAGAIGGFYDPPYAITSAEGLIASTTPPSPASSPTAFPKSTGSRSPKTTTTSMPSPYPPSQPFKSATIFNPLPVSPPPKSGSPNTSASNSQIHDPLPTPNAPDPSSTGLPPVPSSTNVPVGSTVNDAALKSTLMVSPITSLVSIQSPAPSSNPPAIAASCSTIIEGSAPVVIGGTTTTTADSIHTVVNGQTVKLSSGNLHISTSTLAITTQQPVSPAQSTPVVFAGLTFSAACPVTAPAATEMPVVTSGATVSVLPTKSAIVIGTQTLLAGSAAIISDTLISLGPSGLVIGNTIDSAPITAIAVSQPSNTAAPAKVITVGGQTVTATATGFAIGSQTLYPGGDGITVSGAPVSLAIGGTLLFGTSTIPLPDAAVPSQIITLAGQAVTAAASGFAVAGTTLTPGATAVTISRIPVSLAIGSALVTGTSSIPLSTNAPEVVNINGQTITAAVTGIAIAGTVLGPGASGVTISGTVISLSTGETLVVGTSTVVLPGATTTLGIGGVVLSAFGLGGTETGRKNATIPPSVGAASRSNAVWQVGGGLLMAGITCMVFDL